MDLCWTKLTTQLWPQRDPPEHISGAGAGYQHTQPTLALELCTTPIPT